MAAPAEQEAGRAPERGRNAPDVLVEARGLVKRYGLGGGALARLLGAGRELTAVDGVDLRIRRGEAFGLVGESGCGKSTLGRLLLRLIEPTAGEVRFEGRDIARLPEAELRPLRTRMQLVAQDPHAALNPAMSVGEAVADALLAHDVPRGEARARALAAMEEVGLAPAAKLYDRKPAELSGGQKQRVVLARALVLGPSFLVLDEPVSMLDMSVRARVLELLQELRRRRGLTLLFITHDLATARFLCDRVAIMYLGQIVEQGPARRVFERPLHPYTRALLAAIPAPDPAQRGRGEPLRGEVPDAARPPAGCRFHPRCPVSEARCGFGPPDLRDAWEGLAARGRAPALAPPDEWEESLQRVRVPGARPEDVRRLLAAGGPGLAASAQVERLGGDSFVGFPPAERIAQRAVGPQSVRCLLYADARHAAHEPR